MCLLQVLDQQLKVSDAGVDVKSASIFEGLCNDSAC